MKKLKPFSVFLLVLLFSSCQQEERIRNSAFPWYGASLANDKFVSLDQINEENFNKLEVAWRWTSVDESIIEQDSTLWTWTNESTPIMIDGILYTSTSLSQVAAIDAKTGQTIWSYNPESYLKGSPPNHGFVHRGVAFYEDGNNSRVFIGTGDAYLIALNAKSGELVSEFGNNGKIDLTKGLRRPIDRLAYGVSSPPIICRNTLIIGSSIVDYPLHESMPPGDIRGFDINTGEQKWIFESIPQENDPGVETWENESWKTIGNTNVWTIMSADEELGYVFLPFGTPSNDYYGGNRHGDNLYAESLVALDAATGEKVWHFQTTHHGIWDYDLPAAPILMDLLIDGKNTKAVAQLTKQGFCFVFNRETGVPIWPIEERAVPASTVPGEKTSPTQPFPTKPKPFDQQGLSEEDLIDFTPELRKAALDYVNQYDYGPLFTPPSLKGTLQFPGIAGGANWAGGVFNPNNNHLYVPSVTLPFLVKLQKAEGALEFNKYYKLPPSVPSLDGLPLTKPPYGRITAIDMNSGEHSWMSPVGSGPINDTRLKELNLPQLGWPFRMQVLGTQTLLLIAQDGGEASRAYASRGYNIAISSIDIEPSLRAFNYDNGEQIAEIPIPSNARGAMISYLLDGKQYIVIPIGGASKPAELIALALPD
ncbi:pyrroloquinoline quinone-dependent dehydrogenase [Algoriphagus chordae]|uniref:Quinoprotein glucose dehydrogenase n=1 Tax=Algoriphagus chordae TaxID=237019 RepID=A0A2W7QNU5_9BACT|nr:pyrroloquinoline quinone-dependent dehydrogenase [Algoriphagus chordae]PZX50163.1 quinoprotein glucose dehydrogenase [Algoriphagus chordae]